MIWKEWREWPKAELAQFIRAQLFADERAVLSGSCARNDGSQRPDCADRILRDIEAKREILEVHHEDDGGCAGCGLGNDEERMYAIEECPTLRLLASVYADNEDYRPEWKYVAEKRTA